jgi:hypothetical protein
MRGMYARHVCVEKCDAVVTITRHEHAEWTPTSLLLQRRRRNTSISAHRRAMDAARWRGSAKW